MTEAGIELTADEVVIMLLKDPQHTRFFYAGETKPIRAEDLVGMDSIYRVKEVKARMEGPQYNEDIYLDIV